MLENLLVAGAFGPARADQPARADTPALLLLDEIAGGLTGSDCGVLVLDFGRLIGIGEPDAIMASREVREIYLGTET